MTASPASPAAHATRTAHLDALFRPHSVAVIGVSSDAGKLGNSVLRNVINGGFAGDIYPVGRSGGEIEGLRSYSSLAELPKAPDVAFLAVPATAAVDTLRECAMRGVKVAIVGSAGFAEDADEEGIARQHALARIAADTGIRVVGPNCNGVYVTAPEFACGFNAAHARRLPAGGIAVLSHSGALFDSMMRMMESLGGGLSAFVSAGNQVDLDVLDYMEHLLDDAGTRVFALLLDSIADGERFRRLAVQARQRGKAVVAIKIGISAAGAQAATAHSSRLTGSAQAYATLFDASGVAQASTLEGFVTAAVLLDRFGYINGGVGGITSSGAGAALIADIADRYGVTFPAYSVATATALQPFQKYSVLSNPTDIGVFGTLKDADEIFPVIASDVGVGLFLAQIHAFPTPSALRVAESMAAAQQRCGKPTLVLAPGDLPPETRQLFADRDILVLTDSDSCLQAIRALTTPMPAPLADAAQADAALQAELRQRSGAWTEPDSLALLEKFAVPVVPTAICRSADDAVAAARDAGFPVVLKGVVEGIAHKSDLGLVHVNLRDEAAVRNAFAALGAKATAAVQPMIAGSAEAIAGITRAPDVGPMLLAGLGGIHAEALREVTMWSLPATRAAIEQKLAESALGRVLQSSRWRHPAAFGELVDALLRLQNFALAAGDALEAVDINPIMLGAGGTIGVDALIVTKD
jgi:acyl-CoA synthetase (NDP forming)